MNTAYHIILLTLSIIIPAFIAVVKTYKLKFGQYLGQAEPFKSIGLPNNSIIHKKVTGCGATALELEFPRNSIIIEPNVPVIKGKCKKYNKGKRTKKVIQGVYEGVDVDNIVQYIENRVGHKKLLVTPESFRKVAEAIGESMYKDYFITFDEMEKAIQDVDFRSDIINPLDAFFRFKHKCFVSATPLMPSDPRFKDFEHVVIQPDYDYTENIQVCVTNNIVYQLKIMIDQLNLFAETANRKYFIFFKSTARIADIISGLKLEDSSVYCSDDSARDVRRGGIEKAYDDINVKFTKYNFFTSRFFLAVDFDYTAYNCDPIIIMVSDVLAVPHSVIDTETEAIQIVGRFRRPDDKNITVKKDIFHISNYNSKLTNFNETEVHAILKDKQELHQFISKFKPTSDIDYINTFIDEILKMNGFEYFVDKETSQINCFMVDNFINKERVKGYYRSTSSLITQYKSSSHFTVDIDSGYTHHSLTDQELLEITAVTSLEKANEFVSKKVKEIMESEMEPLWRESNLTMLRFSYPVQMAVIDQYGLDSAAKHDYNISAIQQSVKDSKSLSRLIPIIKYIQQNFKLQGYTSKEITSMLTAGIAKTGLTDLKPDLTLLRNAVTISERCNIRKDAKGNWVKGYKITSYLQNFYRGH